MLGYAALAVVAILDKFIISKERVKPMVFVFYSTVFLFPLNIGIFFIKTFPYGGLYAVIALAASTFAFGLFTMYRAFQKSEISHMGPFIGGLIPLLVLILSMIFLKEEMTPRQLVGIILLSLGTIGISIQKKMGKEWQSGIIWALVSVVSFSVSHVTSKFVYNSIGFGSGFIYIWGAMGVIGVLLLLSREVQEIVFPHRSFFTLISEKIFKHKSSKREAAIIAADKVLSGGGVLLVQYAVSLGTVSGVYAVSGVQYGLLVLGVAALSRFFPSYFKEDYGPGEMAGELVAVLVIAAGLFLMV